jgi:hypothetical protein
VIIDGMKNWKLPSKIVILILETTIRSQKKSFTTIDYILGCLREFKDLSVAIKDFVRYAITPLSNEYRYRQVKLIEDSELLSAISLTALKIKTYNICDNLRNKWGDKITRYCTDNDNNIIIELVEEEYKTKSSNSSMNLKEHISFQELNL